MTSPNRDKEKKLSKCCKAEVKIVGGDEGTMFWQCLGCGKGCDLYTKENKPSKKTEWEEGVKFGIKKSHKTWMTRIKKMRKDYKDLLHQRDNVIREKIQGMKKEETIIESCDNCGEGGWGRIWYSKSVGGSAVLCEQCFKDFEIGGTYNNGMIWQRSSPLEQHSDIRLGHIKRRSEKNVGYNQALDDLLTYLSNKT